jgi:hypothetical protein
MGTGLITGVLVADVNKGSTGVPRRESRKYGPECLSEGQFSPSAGRWSWRHDQVICRSGGIVSAKERRNDESGRRLEPSSLEPRSEDYPCSTCATIAVRVVHFVFSMMCLMWALTVGSVMPSAEAISLFVHPLARFCTTVCSRLVN